VPAIQWDKIGDRRFEAGVDRGVLYLPDKAVAWSGLTGIEESPSIDSKSFYQDGIKYLDVKVLSEYSATLRALTYPDEFDQVMGIAADGQGLFIHDQRVRPFSLCYRTRIGNDVAGIDFGYRLHILYDLMAVPNSAAFGTVESNVDPVEFSWALSSTPQALPGYRPTAHLSIKSTDIDAGYLEYVESILYGNELADAYLPTMAEMFDLIANQVTIVDNGDGTWTASGSDRVIQDFGDTFIIGGVSIAGPIDGRYELTIPVH